VLSAEYLGQDGYKDSGFGVGLYMSPVASRGKGQALDFGIWRVQVTDDGMRHVSISPDLV
jgi:hypothetical protein